MIYIADVECTVLFRTKLLVDCPDYNEEELIKELEKSKHLTPISDTVSTWEVVTKNYCVRYVRAQEPDIIVYRGT